jgi:anaerobic selenocysteine-containing dehydrogenase
MAADPPGGKGEALDEFAARQDWRITRRTFLKGAAAATGAVAAADLLGGQFLGGLKPADAAQAPIVETLVRTGHSNNCDGACGHLVHVADGKVRLVEGAF